jgi:putative oxidoreductase
LHTPFLLAVRPYWGWQLVQAGWGNVHLAPIPDFFRSQGILLPTFNAHFLEFIGGLLLIAGLASRLTNFLLADAIFVAYWTGDRESLLSVFSDPGKFYGADPYTFLFASLPALIFGGVSFPWMPQSAGA